MGTCCFYHWNDTISNFRGSWGPGALSLNGTFKCTTFEDSVETFDRRCLNIPPFKMHQTNFKIVVCMVRAFLKAERLHILKNRSNEDSCNMKICHWHYSKSTDWLFSFSRRSSSQSNYSDRRSSCESKDAHQPHSQLPSTGGLKSPRWVESQNAVW